MKNLLSSKRFQLGFTLIELLIVVAIIAVLVSVGAFSYSTAMRNARDAQRKSDLKKIALAMEKYYADNGRYPPPNGSSITSVSYEPQPWIAGLDTYMTTIPVDPVNTQCGTCFYYEYVVFNNRQSYLLMMNLENNGDRERRILPSLTSLTFSPCNEEVYFAEAGSYRGDPYDWCVSSPN